MIIFETKEDWLHYFFQTKKNNSCSRTHINNIRKRTYQYWNAILEYWVVIRILARNNLPRFDVPSVSREIDSYLIYFSAIFSKSCGIIFLVDLQHGDKSQIPRQTSIDIIYQLIARIFYLSIIKMLTLQPKSKIQIKKQRKKWQWKQEKK